MRMCDCGRGEAVHLTKYEGRLCAGCFADMVAAWKVEVIRWTVYGVVDGEQTIDAAHFDACMYVEVDPAEYQLSEADRKEIQDAADRIRAAAWN